MYRVAAKNIQKVRYCPVRMLLEVQFNGEENIYQYFDVPEEVWYNMKNSASLDMYFNVVIATGYRMKCVNRLKKK
ncbi:MAG: KTSC domain-containing protein [Lachnospiraceae bacterium]|nr:KTSC domain-containing protein [Lachnospiraceae bacterium]